MLKNCTFRTDKRRNESKLMVGLNVILIVFLVSILKNKKYNRKKRLYWLMDTD